MALYKNLKSALEFRDDCTALKLSVKGPTFPTEVFSFPHLQEIHLEAPQLKHFPDGLQMWTKVRIISLRAPSFAGTLAPLFQLPALENLKVLETPLEPLRLPLGHTRAPLRFLTLKECGLKKLPLEFGELITLKELHLPNNKLSDLPGSFVDLINLSWLNLDKNDLGHFPQILGKMPKLKHLSLDGNPFPEEEKERIQRVFHLTVE